MPTMIDHDSLDDLIKDVEQLSVDAEFCLKPTEIIRSTTCTGMIIKSYNQNFLRASGYSAEELLGRRHNILRHPDVPQEIFDDLRKTITAGRPWHGVIKNRRKDGGYYWVDSTITPIIENGMIVGYQSTRYPATDSQKLKAKKLYADIVSGEKPPPNTLDDLTPKTSQRYEFLANIGTLALIEAVSLVLGFYGQLELWMVVISFVWALIVLNNMRMLTLIDDNSTELKAIKELARGNFRTKIPKNSVHSEYLELIRATIQNSAANDIDCKVDEQTLLVLMDTIRGMVLITDIDFKVTKYSLSALRLESLFRNKLSNIIMEEFIDVTIKTGLTRRLDRQMASLIIGDTVFESTISPITVRGDLKGYIFLLYYAVKGKGNEY
jgi:PAS domain S-box-containing protein